MTLKQRESRKAWSAAKHAFDIATKGERERTAAHLRAAATAVLVADVEARRRPIAARRAA